MEEPESGFSQSVAKAKENVFWFFRNSREKISKDNPPQDGINYIHQDP